MAENWHAVATAWSLPGSPFQTRGSAGGAGPPLYFLNAFGGCAELFTLTAWLLRDHCRCVLIDWASPPSPCAMAVAHQSRRFTLDDFAAEVAAAADHLGDREFAVYGATFGAAVASRLAAKHPQRVSQLILQGAWERRRLSLGERALVWWHQRSTKSLSQWPSRTEFQAANHRTWFPPQDPDRWAWFLELTGAVPLALMAAEARAIDGVDLRPDYARLTCPTLFLATEGAGPKSVAIEQRLASGNDGFRYEYLHSTGQHPYLTHPHRIAKGIKSHLAGESAAGEGCCSADESAATSTTCCNAETP